MKEIKQHGKCCNFDSKNAWCNRKSISVLDDEPACREFGLRTNEKILTEREEIMENKIYDVAEVSSANMLAVRIRTTIRNTQKIMLDSAISIGQDLMQAQKLVADGEWQEWVEQATGMTCSSARKYMQIAREYGMNPSGN